MKAEFTDIEETLKKLEKIPEYLRLHLGQGNNDEIFKLKTSEATYYSAEIQFEISKKLVDVMAGVKGVVSSSDSKTKWIYRLTVFLLIFTVLLLFVAGWTLWSTEDMIHNDEAYKKEMLKETLTISHSIRELNSFIVSKKIEILSKGEKKYLINDTVFYELRKIKNIP